MPPKAKGQKRKKKGSKSVTEMDFSAAENFIPPLNIDFNVGPGTSGGGFFDQKISNLSNMGKLNKLINERKGKSTYKNYKLIDINKRATRVIKNKLTKKNEFVYSDGRPVKSGLPYHIHYIKNLEEHYMTGSEHNEKSELIFPLKSSKFAIYNNLNKQPSLKLESEIVIPTEQDYSKGFIIRYFARKANEVMSTPFEITKNQINTSSLYIYTSFLWIIKGNRDKVRSLNMMNIDEAKEGIPNIGKLLSPLQFYRGKKEKILNTEEEILDKLGVVKTTQQTTTESNRPSTTTQTQTGPPPGVTTGGAGGAY